MLYKDLSKIKGMSLEDIRNRFLIAVKDTGLNGAEIGRRIPELSSQKLYNLRNERNGITLENIISFTREFPKYSLIWILNEKGSMINSFSKNEAEIAPTSYMQVPMVPVFAQAGFLTGYGDQVYMDELPSVFWEVDKQHKGNYVCFEVKGDSMDDESARSILEGDKILGREVQRHHWINKLHINKWNYIIVHKEEGIVVKKIVEHNVEKGIIKCHSLNPFYDDFELNLNDVIALFNVVDLKRKPSM